MSKKPVQKKDDNAVFGGIFWVFFLSLIIGAAVLFQNRTEVVDFILSQSRDYMNEEKMTTSKPLQSAMPDPQIEILKAELSGQINALKTQIQSSNGDVLSSPVVREKLNEYENKLDEMRKKQRAATRFMLAVSSLNEAIEIAKPYPLEMKVLEEASIENDMLEDDLLPFFKAHAGVGVPSYGEMANTYQELILEDGGDNQDVKRAGKWLEDLKAYFSSLIRVTKKKSYDDVTVEDEIEQAFILQDYARVIKLAKAMDRDDKVFEMWVKSLELRFEAEQKVKQLRKIAFEFLIQSSIQDKK